MHQRLEEPPEGVISGSNDRDVQDPHIELDQHTRRQLREVGIDV
jgi:hypothetical protein